MKKTCLEDKEFQMICFHFLVKKKTRRPHVKFLLTSGNHDHSTGNQLDIMLLPCNSKRGNYVKFCSLSAVTDKDYFWASIDAKTCFSFENNTKIA